MYKNQWVYELVSEKIERTPFVVAITGPSNSGKTTLGEGMNAFFGDNCVHVDLDDYLIPRSERFRLGITGYDPQATHMARMRRDLIDLRDGKVISKPVYDHCTGCANSTEKVSGKELLIINGSPALYEGVRDLSDFSIFLDGDKPELQDEKRKRDLGQRGYSELEARKLWDGLNKDYRKFLGPMKAFASLVVEVMPDYQLVPNTTAVAV